MNIFKTLLDWIVQLFGQPEPSKPAKDLRFPEGRGFYIWRLEKCYGGDLDKIIDRCKKSHITWVAVKCGDQGRPWKQFTKEMVRKFNSAGIRVWAWSYDTPAFINEQVEVYKKALGTGIDGVLVNAEQEWKVANIDKTAAKFMDKLRAVVPKDKGLAHAPFALISYHQKFPYTEFGKRSDWVSPQMYWYAFGWSVPDAQDKVQTSWNRFAQQKPEAARPLIMGGSSWGKTKPSDCLDFEKLRKASGDKAVLYWEFSQTSEKVFDVFTQPF
jgi:hypothetical protein